MRGFYGVGAIACKAEGSMPVNISEVVAAAHEAGKLIRFE
jgi:hypothetical protein